MPSLKLTAPALVAFLFILAPLAAAAVIEADLLRLRDGFDARRDAIFNRLANQPLKTAPKRPPLGPNRPPYTRAYSFSILTFALKSFWLDEFNAEANAALIENCRYYMDDPRARDDRDSFYWSADLLCRIVEFYGSSGSRAQGRLTPEAETVVYELMWAYCHDRSNSADAEIEQSKTWHVHESENHHLQLFSTLWHFSRLLAASPQYKDRQYASGGTPAQHLDAWTRYSKEFCRERIRKGLFIETASGNYNVVALKGIYNFYDFSDDPELRRLARCLLDLYWADWAQEQIDFVRGGAAARVYQGLNSQLGTRDHIADIARFYLSENPAKPPRDADFTILTSAYRMPLIVMDLALDTPGRGVYEIRQRIMGLAQPGFHRNPGYRLRTDTGGIVRYSFCTPDFIIGTALLEARPAEDWTAISAQNRWLGVIFAGHPDARIYPECRATDRNRNLNQHWSVQRKGTLIAQKLQHASRANEMRIWFSEPGLTQRTERDGWVFVQAPSAYAAVRPAAGGYEWQPSDTPAPGQWLRCNDEWTPVIIEVARQSDFPSFDAFQRAILANPLRFERGQESFVPSTQRAVPANDPLPLSTLTYRGLAGDTFTFHADFSAPPQINGAPVDYAPEKVFDSPFIQSDWNSGRVTLRKADRQLLIDANAPTTQPNRSPLD